MRKLLALITVAAILSLAQVVSAGPFEDGVTAYDRGDYATALKLWRPLAEQGNAGAQNALGVMYQYGRGVAQDYKEAAKWWRLAAAQGNVSAQDNLGFMYQYGQSIAQDYKEAVKWYRLAAEQGDAAAQLNLGAMYEDGRGVAQDYVHAHMWYSVIVLSSSGKNARMATKSRDRVAAKMTPAQIAKAQEMAPKCQQSGYRDCGEPASP